MNLLEYKPYQHTRAINFLIDRIIGMPVFAVCIAFGIHVILGQDSILLHELSLLASFVCFIIYYILCESAFGGKTLGKMFTGTTVLRMDGNIPSFGQIVKRSLIRFVPLNFLSMSFTEDKICWHEKWSNTLTVEDKARFKEYTEEERGQIIENVRIKKEQEIKAYNEAYDLTKEKKTIRIQAFKLRIRTVFKKSKYYIAGFIILLLLTNPTITDFKHSQYGGSDSRKTSDFFIFSFYEEYGNTYLGILKNFIRLY